MTYRKSSYCPNANCVEVQLNLGSVTVRDSKHPDGKTLLFSNDEWGAFLAGVRAGEFDLPDGAA